MDARLTEEQEHVQRTAGQLARALAPESPAHLDELGAHPEAWPKLAAAGLLGMRAPEAVGGSALSGVEVALVAEELGRACAPVPFVGAVIATQWLSDAGADPALLSQLLDGELHLAPVLAPDLRGPALPHTDGVAFDAHGAAAGIVLDESTGALTGVALGNALESQDLTRGLRRVESSAAELFSGRLGKPLGTDALLRARSLALTAVSADLVGVATGALDRAVAYTKEREQFGVAVATFQAVQHMAADALVSIEAARGLTAYAAWAVDALPAADALEAASAAKAFASEHGKQVCETAIQMHGGIGMTWEAMPHVHLRRALLGRAILGDEHEHYALLAEAARP